MSAFFFNVRRESYSNCINQNRFSHGRAEFRRLKDSALAVDADSAEDSAEWFIEKSAGKYASHMWVGSHPPLDGCHSGCLLASRIYPEGFVHSRQAIPSSSFFPLLHLLPAELWEALGPVSPVFFSCLPDLHPSASPSDHLHPCLCFPVSSL